jgi:peptidoglycan/LPS O-acetylase OafA/YrhL
MQTPAAHLTHPKYRPDIDGLRAVAVLSVVVFHAFPSLLPGGFIGVDIFFVISGFLISTIIFGNLDDDRFSFREFYARRVKRIFPALLLVLIAVYLFGWLELPAPDYKRLGNHIEGGAGFFSNFILMKESGYFDAAAETKPLLHLWSLAVEEQFYIVWPLLVWLAWRLRFNRLMLTLAIIVGLFALTISQSHEQGEVANLYYSPQTRFWELLIGATLACINRRDVFANLRYRLASALSLSGVNAGIGANLKAFTGAVFLAAALLCITKEKPFPGWWALLPTVGAALIISAGTQAWINRQILSSRLLVWIGLISFPLYLWHWPLLSFARILAAETPSLSMRITLVGLSILLAWFTRSLIEQPIRFGRQTWSKTAGLVVGMLIVGGVGRLTFIAQGLSFRHGITELSMENGRFECDGRKKNSGCLFGNPHAEKLVVVWGDSHVEHLTKALNIALGNEYRFHSVTNGSCFMGEKILVPTVGNQKDCRQAIEKLESLRSDKIYAVIRSQRWHGYGIREKKDVEDAVDDAIHAYGFHPEKFIIVGAAPDVDIECEVSNYYGRRLTGKKTCKSVDEVKAYERTFIATTRAMHVPANVHFVYPYNIICPNDVCTVIKGSTSNFSDMHHLSTTGAMQIMPEIAKILAEPGYGQLASH